MIYDEFENNLHVPLRPQVKTETGNKDSIEDDLVYQLVLDNKEVHHEAGNGKGYMLDVV